MLKKAVLGFIHEIGISRQRFFNQKSHDSCRSVNSESLKSQIENKKVKEPKIRQSTNWISLNNFLSNMPKWQSKREIACSIFAFAEIQNGSDYSAGRWSARKIYGFEIRAAGGRRPSKLGRLFPQ